ncbi:CBS domain-containing protein [Streptomyces noursei]|uniref:CBS domain-containing protein n=1 Tax=Streptomyces noursei TaxID=1971 RepID=UPI0019A87E7D|nr:CBS domain-containing protein [Streptomyces noursei]MCZ1013020.1 CBS domain-containing protein [Streptomyces noursei]GGX43075.1 hypothetical protein GCM10010341_76330 [Streptomyces noursei]
MRVRDVMRTPVVSVAPEATLGETARLMQQRTVGCVAVVCGEAVLGMVTDRDLAVRGLGAERSGARPRRSVR